jgi:hypothetical protein
MQDVIKCAFTCIPIYQKGQESVFLLVKGNRIADGRRVFFRRRPVFFNCFLLLSFITNPFKIHTNPDFGRFFCLCGQVVLSIGNHSEMLKTQLAVFR